MQASTPKRQIGANQTIFEVMAAERDKLPDVQKGKKKEDSDDDALVVETDDNIDLAKLIKDHRGGDPNSFEENQLLQHGAFI